jgi:hypothetical protein
MKTWRRSAAEPQVKLLGMIDDRSWKGSDLRVMDPCFNALKDVAYSCLVNINEILLSEFPASMDAMLCGLLDVYIACRSQPYVSISDLSRS